MIESAYATEPLSLKSSSPSARSSSQMADSSASTPTPAQTATTASASASATPAKPAFRYFRAPSSSQQPRNDLPDNYFDVTPADVRAQQASLAARRDALQNAPLRTAAMRETEDKKRRSRWPETRIRIKFADRSVLEKTFPSTDKIRAVYAFVRSSLREDVKPIKFVLYQSPPKREYKVSDPKVRDLSLAELDFAPSSVLLIKFDDERFDHAPAPLDPSILALAEDFPTPPVFSPDPNPDKADRTGGPSRPRTNLAFGKKDDGERKYPKWFKIGQSA
ncbi:hypothetical protein C8Q79DRAFT_478349 [Trametes meyenii]|nr:hypothetical protein C8Q79DRAFT_478349 [Trametes meyenii]